MFWFVAAVMTLVATIATIRPLLRRKAEPVVPRPRHDAEVYRAQLEELEADLARGSIGVPEAATARTEIARRLLRSEDAARAGSADAGTRGGRFAVVAGLCVALLLPLATFLFYDRAGSPDISDMPLASREPAGSTDDVATLIAAIERRLSEKPDDATGWGVVAPIYLRMGEADKAVAAFRNVLRLSPPTVEKQVGLGEALMQQADGRVTDEARQVFEKALALDPTGPAARFYLALALSQTERYGEAEAAWKQLIADSPADAPWLAVAKAALADAEAKLGTDRTAPAAPGPTTADMAAAEGLSETDRQAMIEGMVSQLASRLDAQPGDPEGWKRLMRSYMVLGRAPEAEAAGRKALGVFSRESADGKSILAFAGSLGLNLSGDATTR